MHTKNSLLYLLFQTVFSCSVVSGCFVDGISPSSVAGELSKRDEQLRELDYLLGAVLLQRQQPGRQQDHDRSSRFLHTG